MLEENWLTNFCEPKWLFSDESPLIATWTTLQGYLRKANESSNPRHNCRSSESTPGMLSTPLQCLHDIEEGSKIWFCGLLEDSGYRPEHEMSFLSWLKLLNRERRWSHLFICRLQLQLQPQKKWERIRQFARLIWLETNLKLLCYQTSIQWCLLSFLRRAWHSQWVKKNSHTVFALLLLDIWKVLSCLFWLN